MKNHDLVSTCQGRNGAGGPGPPHLPGHHEASLQRRGKASRVCGKVIGPWKTLCLTATTIIFLLLLLVALGLTRISEVVLAQSFGSLISVVTVTWQPPSGSSWSHLKALYADCWLIPSWGFLPKHISLCDQVPLQCV